MVLWDSHPDRKVEVGTVDLSTDSVDVLVYRLENAVSRAHLVANDNEGVNYIGNIDAFDTLKISFRYGSDSWTQVFEGIIEGVSPTLSKQGQLVNVVAYGYGRALRNTHSHVNYGVESANSALDTPTEILDDLVDNRINKGFDGDVTNYAITKTKIKTINTPSIQFLPGYYQNNLALINEVCQIYTADQAGAASIHWYVDPSKNLWVDVIGDHSVDTVNWPSYWGGSQVASTLVEGTDFTGYNFHKNVLGFANKIILSTNLRKPGYDYWTEQATPTNIWGTDGGLVSLTGDAVTVIVGSYSMEIEQDNNPGYCYYPSTEDAAWDITKCGSIETIPTINFYFYKDANVTELTTYLILFTTDHSNDYYYSLFSTFTDPDNEWVHRSLPVGPYWKTKDESRRFRWVKSGAADWTDINGVAFFASLWGAAPNGHLFIDDLHFNGKLIREAENTTSIAAYNEHQKVIRMDVAVDDSLDASDDSGTAGQLAYAELLTNQKISRVGKVTTPGIIDVLPGELTHIHAGLQSGGSYRINDDFRIKEIIHSFTRDGFMTTLDLTDDVTNTFAVGSETSHSSFASTLSRVMRVDPEAKNLKASGIDPLISRLSIDYP